MSFRAWAFRWVKSATMTIFGEYAYGLMDERETLAVPERLSWEEAGAVPVAFLVVYDMLLAQGRPAGVAPAS